jgi:hypothetical protein
MTGEPIDLSVKPGQTYSLTVEGAFADPDQVRLEGEAFSQELDLLQADTRGAPVYFGRDKDIKFVEHHENRPGIPAPLGMSYPMRPHRVEFFAEIAPILDSATSTSLGWGGGVGIRFYLGR